MRRASCWVLGGHDLRRGTPSVAFDLLARLYVFISPFLAPGRMNRSGQILQFRGVCFETCAWMPNSNAVGSLSSHDFPWKFVSL